MYGRANSTFELIVCGRLQPLREKPVQGNIATVAGLRVKGKNIADQRIRQASDVEGRGRTETKKDADGSAVPPTLAAIKINRSKAFNTGIELCGKTIQSTRIDLVVAFWEPSVQFHELQLHRSPLSVMPGNSASSSAVNVHRSRRSKSFHNCVTLNSAHIE